MEHEVGELRKIANPIANAITLPDKSPTPIESRLGRIFVKGITIAKITDRIYPKQELTKYNELDNSLFISLLTKANKVDDTFVSLISFAFVFLVALRF